MVLVIVFDRIARKKCRCWRICEEVFDFLFSHLAGIHGHNESYIVE